MPTALLTEFQSACRAAHQQVQMLQDLYEHLAEKEDLRKATSLEVERRIGELRVYQGILARKLKQQDLLPTRPDPEKEGLLELVTEIKAAFNTEERRATAERLATEEGELLELTEQMLRHDDDAAVAEARAAIREAIASLSSVPAAKPDSGK